MRGVTIDTGIICGNQIISTHTPHARRDKIIDYSDELLENFNSHASCEA